MSPRAVEEVFNLAASRAKAFSTVHARMAEYEDTYYGRKALPLPELAADEKPAVPNLVAAGTDQLARRITSTWPMAEFASLRPGIKASDDRARDRRDVLAGWWAANRMTDVLLPRRARHLLGYSASPVCIKPNLATGMPEWHTYHPREVLPAASEGAPPLVPDDVVLTYTVSAPWVRANYPGALALADADASGGGHARHDGPVRLLQYTDSEEVALFLVGTTTTDYARVGDEGDWWLSSGTNGRRDWGVRLDSYANRAGRPLVAMPTRIALDEPIGAFDGVIGIYENQAMLMALQTIALMRNVFAEPWLSPHPNSSEEPRVINRADGRTREVGVVAGGRLEWNRPPANMEIDRAIDRHERALRVESGLSADMFGESGGSIRTGRRGEAVLSATVDFHVQETQRLLAASLCEEDKIAIAVDKGWFSGSKPINVAWKGARVARNYDTAKTWETDDHDVRFPLPGSDANSLIIGLGQRVGTGLMSKRTAMQLDPMVADAESESDIITTEAIDAAALSSFQQQAASGALALADLARIKKLIITGVAWEDAVERVQREAQERQASSGPVGAPDGPVMPGSPEAQPGLAAPEAGMEQPAAIPEPTASASNLAQTLNQLRASRSSMAAAAAG